MEKKLNTVSEISDLEVVITIKGGERLSVVLGEVDKKIVLSAIRQLYKDGFDTSPTLNIRKIIESAFDEGWRIAGMTSSNRKYVVHKDKYTDTILESLQLPQTP